jgi:hypothetical protein
VDLHIGPGDVAHESLSTHPGLQTCSVQATGDGDAVEVNVGNVGELPLTFS